MQADDLEAGSDDVLDEGALPPLHSCLQPPHRRRWRRQPVRQIQDCRRISTLPEEADTGLRSSVLPTQVPGIPDQIQDRPCRTGT